MAHYSVITVRTKCRQKIKIKTSGHVSNVNTNGIFENCPVPNTLFDTDIGFICLQAHVHSATCTVKRLLYKIHAITVTERDLISIEPNVRTYPQYPSTSVRPQNISTRTTSVTVNSPHASIVHCRLDNQATVCIQRSSLNISTGRNVCTRATGAITVITDD